MPTAVIIPTYNESLNIEKLMRQLFKLYSLILVFVVDDSSPDHTAEIVSRLRKKYRNLFLIKRKSKSGRGSAVIEGLKAAFGNKDIEYFIEMDADFSHRPEEIAKMLNKAKKFDVVIGSRYLPSSRIYGWGIGRRIFSRLANFYCRIILRIPISDYTNGFRCYRRVAVEKLVGIRIHSKGYIVLSEVAYFLYRRGFRFAEIPTIFVNRIRGQSNFNFSEIGESLISVVKIRFVN